MDRPSDYLTQAQTEAAAFLSINLLDVSDVDNSCNQTHAPSSTNESDKAAPSSKSETIASSMALGKALSKALFNLMMTDYIPEDITKETVSSAQKLGEAIVRKQKYHEHIVSVTLPEFDSNASKFSRFLHAAHGSFTSSSSSSLSSLSTVTPSSLSSSSSSTFTSSAALRRSGFASTPVLQNPRDRMSPRSSNRLNDRQGEASGFLATLLTLRRTLRASGKEAKAANVREELFNLVHELYSNDHHSDIGQINISSYNSVSRKKSSAQTMDEIFSGSNNSFQRQEKSSQNRLSDQSSNRSFARHSITDIENFLIAVASDAIADLCEPTALAVRDALLLCCSLLSEEIFMKGRSFNHKEQSTQNTAFSERLLTMLWRIVQLQSTFVHLNSDQDNFADEKTLQTLYRVRCISKCSANVHQRERIDNVSCDPNLFSGTAHPVFERRTAAYATSSLQATSPINLEKFQGSSLWVQNEASWNVSRIIMSQFDNTTPCAPFPAFPNAPCQSAWIDVAREMPTPPQECLASLMSPLMTFISQQEPWNLFFTFNDKVNCIDLGLNSSRPRLIASCALSDLISYAGPYGDASINSEDLVYSISGISDCLNGSFLIFLFCRLSKGDCAFQTRVLVVSKALTSANWSSALRETFSSSSGSSSASSQLFYNVAEGDAVKIAQILVGLLLNERVGQLQLEHYLHLFSTRSQSLIVTNAKSSLMNVNSQDKETKLTDEDDNEVGGDLSPLSKFKGCSSIMRSSDDSTHVLIVVDKRCASILRTNFGSLIIPDSEVAILVTFKERLFVRAVCLQAPTFDNVHHGLSAVCWTDEHCLHVVRVSRDEEAFDEEGREEKARIESYCVLTGTLVNSGKDAQAKSVALNAHSVLYTNGLQATVSLQLVSSSSTSERFLIRYSPHIVNRALDFGLREFTVPKDETLHISKEDMKTNSLPANTKNVRVHSETAPPITSEIFKNASAFEKEDTIFSKDAQQQDSADVQSLHFSPHKHISVAKEISLILAIASDFFNSSLFDPSARILLQVAAIAELASEKVCKNQSLSFRGFLNLLHSVLSGISHRVLCVYSNTEIEEVGVAISSMRLSIDGGAAIPLVSAIYSLLQKQSTSDTITGNYAKWVLSTHCLLLYSNENEKQATDEAFIFSAKSASVGLIGGAYIGTDVAVQSLVATSIELVPGLCVSLLYRCISTTASSIHLHALDLLVRFTLAFGLNSFEKPMAPRVHTALRVIESLISLNEQKFQNDNQTSQILKSLQNLCLSLLPRFFGRLSLDSLVVNDTLCSLTTAITSIATRSYSSRFSLTSSISDTDTGNSQGYEAHRDLSSQQVLKLPLPVNRVSAENTAPPFSSVEKSKGVFALCERSHHRQPVNEKVSAGPDCEPVGWASASLIDFSSKYVSHQTDMNIDVVVPSIVLCAPGHIADAVLYIGVPSLAGIRLSKGSISAEDTDDNGFDKGDDYTHSAEAEDSAVVFETCIRPRNALSNDVLADPRLQVIRKMLQEMSEGSAPSRARRLALHPADPPSSKQTTPADLKRRELLPRSVRARGGISEELFDTNYPVVAISVRYSRSTPQKAQSDSLDHQNADLVLSISNTKTALVVLANPLPASSAAVDPKPRWDAKSAINNSHRGPMSREMANEFLKGVINDVAPEKESGRVDAAADERLLSGTSSDIKKTEPSAEVNDATLSTGVGFVINAPFLLPVYSPRTILELSAFSTHQKAKVKSNPKSDVDLSARQGYTASISACEFLVRLLSLSSKQELDKGDQSDDTSSSNHQVELDRWLSSPLFSGELAGKSMKESSRELVGTLLRNVNYAIDDKTLSTPINWVWMLQQQVRLSSHKLLREMAWGFEDVNIAERCVAIAIIWHAGEDILSDTLNAFRYFGGLIASSINDFATASFNDESRALDFLLPSAERGKKYFLEALSQARRIRRWMFDERKLVMGLSSPSVSSNEELSVSSSSSFDLDAKSFYSKLAIHVKQLACVSIESPVSNDSMGIESSSRYLIPLLCSRTLNVERVVIETQRRRVQRSLKACANGSGRTLLSCLLRSSNITNQRPGSTSLCNGLDNEKSVLDRLLRIISSSALPFSQDLISTHVSEASSALSCVDSILLHVNRREMNPSLLTFASDILRCLIALSPSLSFQPSSSTNEEESGCLALENEAKEVADRLGGLSSILSNESLLFLRNQSTNESSSHPSPEILDISPECKASSRRNNNEAKSLLTLSSNFNLTDGWEAPVFQREAAAALREAVSRGGPRVGVDVSRAPFLDILLPHTQRSNFHSLFARVPIFDPSRNKDYSNIPSDFLISVSPVEKDDDASCSAWNFGDISVIGVNSNPQSIYEPIYATIDQSMPWLGVAGWTPVPAASMANAGGGAWSSVRRVRALEATPPNYSGSEGGWRCLLSRSDLDRWWGLSGNIRHSMSSLSSTLKNEEEKGGEVDSQLRFPIARIRISLLSAESNASRAKLLGLSVFAINANQVLRRESLHSQDSLNVGSQSIPTAIVVHVARVFEFSLANTSSSSLILRSTACNLLEGMVVNEQNSPWTRKTALALLMKSYCISSVAKCVQHLLESKTMETESISCLFSLIPPAASLILIATSNDASSNQSNPESSSTIITKLLNLVERLHPLSENELQLSIKSKIVCEAASRDLAVASWIALKRKETAAAMDVIDDNDNNENEKEERDIFPRLISILEQSADSLYSRNVSSQSLTCRLIWAVLHVLRRIFNPRRDSKADASATLQEGMLAFLEGYSPQSCFSGSVFSNQTGPRLFTLVVIQSLLKNDSALVQCFETKSTQSPKNATLGPSFSVSRSRLVPLQVGIAKQHSNLGVASFGSSASKRLTDVLSRLVHLSLSMTKDSTIDPLLVAHGHTLLSSTMQLIGVVSESLSPTSLASLVNSLPEHLVDTVVSSSSSSHNGRTPSKKMLRSALQSVSVRRSSPSTFPISAQTAPLEPENDQQRQELLMVVAPGFNIVNNSNDNDEEDKKDEEEDEASKGLYISSSTSEASSSSSLLPHNVHKSRSRQRSHSSDIDGMSSSAMLSLRPSAKSLPFGWMCDVDANTFCVWIDEEVGLCSYFNFIEMQSIDSSSSAGGNFSAQRLVLPEEASAIITEGRLSTLLDEEDKKSLSGVAVLLEFVDAHGLFDSFSSDTTFDEKVDTQLGSAWNPSFLSTLSTDVRAVAAAGGVPLISLPNASEKAASIAAAFAYLVEPTSRVLSVSSARSLRASLLDLRVWGASLTVGSRVDAVLPLTGAWAKGSIIQQAPAPFQSWLRVDFDNLGPEWRRWIPWEFTASHIVWGKAEIAPLGWVTGAVELSIHEKPRPDTILHAEHYIESQNNISSQQFNEDATSLKFTQQLSFSGLDNELNPKNAIERDLRSSCCLALAACVESPLRDAVRSDRETISHFALLALTATGLKYALESWRASLSVGSLLDACDTHGKFYEAKIVESTPTDVKVRFLGWCPSSNPEKFDERIPRNGSRLLPKSCKIRDWRRVQVGDEIEARDDRTVIDHTVVDVNAEKGLIRTVPSASPVTTAGGVESSFDMLNQLATNPALPTALVTNWHSIHDIFRFACFGTHRRPRQWSEVDREQEGVTTPHLPMGKPFSTTYLYDKTMLPTFGSLDSSVTYQHQRHQLTTSSLASCISMALKWKQDRRDENERLRLQSESKTGNNSTSLTATQSSLDLDQSLKNEKASMSAYIERALQVCGFKNVTAPVRDVALQKLMSKQTDAVSNNLESNKEFIELGEALMEGIEKFSNEVSLSTTSTTTSATSTTITSAKPTLFSSALASHTSLSTQPPSLVLTSPMSFGFEPSKQTLHSDRSMMPLSAQTLPDLIKPLPDTLLLRPTEVPSSVVKLQSLSASLTLSSWLRLPPLLASNEASNVGGVLLYQAAMMDLPDPVLPGTLVEARFAVYRWYPACVERMNSDGTYEVAYEDGDRSSSLTRDRLRPRVGARQALSISVLNTGALQASISVFCEPAEPADTLSADKTTNVESSVGTSPEEPPSMPMPPPPSTTTTLDGTPSVSADRIQVNSLLAQDIPLMASSNVNSANDNADDIAAYVQYRQLRQSQASAAGQAQSNTAQRSSPNYPPRRFLPINAGTWNGGEPTQVLEPQQNVRSPRKLLQEQQQYRIAFTVTSSSCLSDAKWTHVAVSASNGILALYINGVCEARMAAELFPRSNSVYIGGACRLPVDPIDLQKCTESDVVVDASNIAQAFRIVDPVPIDTQLPSEWVKAFNNSAVRSLFAAAPKVFVHDLSIQEAWATSTEVKRLMEAGGNAEHEESKPRRSIEAKCVSRAALYKSIVEKAISSRSPRSSTDRWKISEKSPPPASISSSTSAPAAAASAAVVRITSSTTSSSSSSLSPIPQVVVSDRSELRFRPNYRRTFLPTMAGGPDVNSESTAPSSISEEELNELRRTHREHVQLGELGQSSAVAIPSQLLPSTPPLHPSTQSHSHGERAGVLPILPEVPPPSVPPSIPPQGVVPQEANVSLNENALMMNTVQYARTESCVVSHSLDDNVVISRLIKEAKNEISSQMDRRLRDGQRQIAVSRILKVAFGPQKNPSIVNSSNLSYLSTPIPTLVSDNTEDDDDKEVYEGEEEEGDENEYEEEENVKVKEGLDVNNSEKKGVNPQPSSPSHAPLSSSASVKGTPPALLSSSSSTLLNNTANAVQGVVSQAEAFNVLLERPGLLVWCDLYDKRLPCVLGPPITPISKFERGSSRKFTVTLLPWPSAGSLGGTTASVEISNMLVLRPQPSVSTVSISSPSTPVSSSKSGNLRGPLSAHASPSFRGGGGGGGGDKDSSLENRIPPPSPPPTFMLPPRSQLSTDGFSLNSVRIGIDSIDATSAVGVSPMLSSRSPLRLAVTSATEAVAVSNVPFMIDVSNPPFFQQQDVSSPPRRGNPHSSNSSLNNTPHSAGRDANRRNVTGSPVSGRAGAVALSPRGLEQWAMNQSFPQQVVDAHGVFLQQQQQQRDSTTTSSSSTPPFTMRFVTLQQFAGEVASLASYLAHQKQQEMMQELHIKRQKIEKDNTGIYSSDNDDSFVADASDSASVMINHSDQVKAEEKGKVDEVKSRLSDAETDSILSLALISSCKGLSRVLLREAENGTVTLQVKDEVNDKENVDKGIDHKSTILVHKSTLSAFIWSLATEKSDRSLTIARSLSLSNPKTLLLQQDYSFIKSLLLSSLGKISLYLGCFNARSYHADLNYEIIEAAALAESSFFVIIVVSRHIRNLSSHSTFAHANRGLLLSLLISVLTSIVHNGQSISSTLTSPVAIVNVPSESDILLSVDPILALECAITILQLIPSKQDNNDQEYVALSKSITMALSERLEDLRTLATMCSETTNKESTSSSTIKTTLDASVAGSSSISTSSSLSLQVPALATRSSSRRNLSPRGQTTPLDMTALMFDAASGRLLPEAALAAGATTAAAAASYSAQVAANALSMRPLVVLPRSDGPVDTGAVRHGGRVFSRDVIAESIRNGIATANFLPLPTISRMFSPRLCRLANATIFEIETRLLPLTSSSPSSPLGSPRHNEDTNDGSITANSSSNINKSSISTDSLLTLESCLDDLDLDKVKHLNWTRSVDVSIISCLDNLERVFVGEQWRLSRSFPSLVRRSVPITSINDSTDPTVSSMENLFANRHTMSRYEFFTRQASILTDGILGMYDVASPEGERPQSSQGSRQAATSNIRTSTHHPARLFSSRSAPRDNNSSQVNSNNVTRDAAPHIREPVVNSETRTQDPTVNGDVPPVSASKMDDALCKTLQWLDLDQVVLAVNKEREDGSQLTREHISARIVLILRLVAATISSLQSLSFSSNGDGDTTNDNDNKNYSSYEGISSRLGQRLLRSNHLLPLSVKLAVFRASLSISRTQINTARAVAAASSAASAAITASSTSIESRSDDSSQPGGIAVDRARALAAAPQGSVEAALLRSLSMDGGGEGHISWGLMSNSTNRVQTQQQEQGPSTTSSVSHPSSSTTVLSPLSLTSSSAAANRHFYSTQLWKVLRRELNLQWPALLLVCDSKVAIEAFTVLFPQSLSSNTYTVRSIEIQPISTTQSPSLLDTRSSTGGPNTSQSSGPENGEVRQGYGAEGVESRTSRTSPWRHYDPVSDDLQTQQQQQNQQEQQHQQEEEQQFGRDQDRPRSVRLSEAAQQELSRMIEHDTSRNAMSSANSDAPVAYAGAPSADADADADDNGDDDNDDDDDEEDDEEEEEVEEEEDEDVENDDEEDEVINEGIILNDMINRVNDGDIEAILDVVVNSMTESDFQVTATALQGDSTDAVINSSTARQLLAAIEGATTATSAHHIVSGHQSDTMSMNDFFASTLNQMPSLERNQSLSTAQQSNPSETPLRWLLPSQPPTSSPSPPSSNHVVLLPPTPSTHFAFLDGSVIRISISRWLTETITSNSSDSLNVKGVRAKIFPQLLASLEGALPRGALRQSSRPWRVEFLGEGGTDAGGLFAEALTAAIEDILPKPNNTKRSSFFSSSSSEECVSVPRVTPLQFPSFTPLVESITSTIQPMLPLFVPTPNAKRGDGSRQECAYPNPLLLDPVRQWTGVRRATALRLSFVGRLIGVSLRLSIAIPLVLPPVMWALIQHVGGIVHEDDQTSRSSKSRTVRRLLSTWTSISFSRRGGEEVTSNSDIHSFSVNQLMITFLSPTERVVTRALQFLNRQCPNWLSTFDSLLQGREYDAGSMKTSIECKKLVRMLLPSASCIAFGLDAAVPLLPLRLFSAEQFERLVTGTAGIDVDLLQSRTTYEGWLLPLSRSEANASPGRNTTSPLLERGGGGVIANEVIGINDDDDDDHGAEEGNRRQQIPTDATSRVTPSPSRSTNTNSSSNSNSASTVNKVTKQEDHPSVIAFWQALRDMSPAEQESVMMFIYARRRLPSANIPWPSNFTLMRMGRDAPDQSLPCGHTCSFQLDLPAYSSYQVCKRQLLVAAASCIGYDLDGGSNGPGGE